MLGKIGVQFKKPKGILGKFVSGLMKKGNQPKYDLMIKELNVSEGDSILEIGYGPGIGIEMITSLQSKINVDGIDFSELMFKEASKRNKKKILDGKVRLYMGDFINYSFNGNKYNKIFCINVIYFWDELITPFQKANSLLKENGCFYIYMSDKERLDKIKFTNNTAFNKYAIEHVTEKLKSAGFTKIETNFVGGYYIKAFK